MKTFNIRIIFFERTILIKEDGINLKIALNIDKSLLKDFNSIFFIRFIIFTKRLIFKVFNKTIIIS